MYNTTFSSIANTAFCNLMNFMVKLNKKSPLFFVFVIITASLSIVLYNQSYNINTIHDFIYLILFINLISYLLYCLRCYFINYNPTIRSFIAITILILQISFLIYIKFLDIQEPFYIENLSYFTYLRYIMSIILCIIGGFFIFLKLPLKNPIQFYEEIRLFFFSPYNYKLQPLMFSVMQSLAYSKKYRIIYLFTDIFFTLILKIFVLFILLKVIAFHGDLRLLISMAPLTVLNIIFTHLRYYFEYEINENSTVIRELLTVTPHEHGYLLFTLTKIPNEYNFTIEKDLPRLSKRWIELSNLSLFFEYKKILKKLNIALFIIQIFCSCAICTIFLRGPFLESTSSLATIGSTPGFFKTAISIIKSPWYTSKNWFHTTRPTLYAPRTAAMLQEQFENKLKIISSGKYNVGHPLIGEQMSDGTFRVDGFLTHGNPQGNYDLTLFNILPHSINNTLNKGPQHFIAFKQPLYINVSWATPIQSSSSILENPYVKDLLDKFLTSLQN